LVETKIVWIIDGWNKIKHFVSSKIFHLGGCEWNIGVYTNGDDEDCRGFLSIYLFLEKSQLKNQTIHVNGHITLLNHKHPKLSIKKEILTTFPQKASMGWGERRAIEVSQITSEAGFLYFDKLYFEIDMMIKQVIIWV